MMIINRVIFRLLIELANDDDDGGRMMRIRLLLNFRIIYSAKKTRDGNG